MHHHKKYITTLGLILSLCLGLTILFAESSTSNVAAKNGIKKVSFVKQTKAKGKHIWFKATGDDATKDSIIEIIFVVGSGKLTAYQIFDDNITLEKLSTMSNNAIIELAKDQDKKYATTGAILEVKAVQSGQDQVGLETDLQEDGDLIMGEIPIEFTFTGQVNDIEDGGGAYYINHHKAVNLYRTKQEALADVQTDTSHDGNGIEYTNATKNVADLQPVTSSKERTDSNFAAAVIDHINQTPYQKPKAQKISVKTIMSDSDDTIRSQTISYQSIDFFKNIDLAERVYNVAKKNQTDFLNLVTLSLTDSYDFPEPSRTGFDESATDEVSDTAKIQNQGAALYKQIFGSEYYSMTEGFYGYHEFKKSSNISGRISRKINDVKYIGTYIGNDTTYLLTKAQNSSQTAALSK